ncbi:MAG TPA: sigma-54 dependent transcriptional regulator [Terriglobales bacterium]|nr:sigma-54 dependent transcriptional regulator [Terriglobales bacterium]
MQEEVDLNLGSEEIIGESPALNRVLALAKKVARSDTPVLIAGEPGSGKESVARAIHRVSSRRNESFVKVNCATTGAGLESELFGYEKGASNGAAHEKTGRLELADKGTLFLDEVAQFPLDLQPKLLRVLKRGEFERQGGARTSRVNVRLIASTRQDLKKWVAENRFREDLYDQLKAALIQVPPLRERREDILMLARYFVQKFARRMNNHIESIPPEAMDALLNHHWPGNVRQLESFIERSVILTEGSTLRAPLSEL